MKILKGCRMTCATFERTFVPSFRNFSFRCAYKIAEKLLESQDSEKILIQLVRAFNQSQMTQKQPVKVKKYISEHSHSVKIDAVIENLIAISRKPTEYQTPCCDTGIDVFVHQNMIYAVPLSVFVEEFKLPKSVEDFSYFPEILTSDNSHRKETWQKLYKNGRMRMEIINASKNLGIDEIKNQLLNPPTPKIKKIKDTQDQTDIQAA